MIAVETVEMIFGTHFPHQSAEELRLIPSINFRSYDCPSIWIIPSSIFGNVHNHFWDIKIFKLVCRQYRAWSDCTNVAKDI